jgi:hypothetical protein
VPSVQQAIFQRWREGGQAVFECGEKAAGTVRGGRLVRRDGVGFANELTAAMQPWIRARQRTIFVCPPMRAILRRNSYGFWTNAAKLSGEPGVGFVRVDLRSPLQMSLTK